jgi:hypothetical protein
MGDTAAEALTALLCKTLKVSTLGYYLPLGYVGRLPECPR